MNYKLLGNSGLRVSELALGTMTFGENWGWGATKEESKKIFDLYVEAGGNFIDTANVYTEGHSEQLLGEFIKEKRDKLVVATKFTGSTVEGDPNSWGNHRKNIMLAVEKSLKNLGTDYIDLYWLHIWDYTTRPQEVLRALDDLVKQGKILYTGISDTPAWIVSQSNAIAELKGWTPFTAIQIEYNLLQRSVEFDLLSMAKTLGLGILAWSPLSAGVLSGKFHEGENDSKREFINKDGRINEHSTAVVIELIRIAKEMDKSPSQIAINWLIQQHDQIFPLIGARKISQLQDNLEAISFTLPAEHLEALNKVSKPELVFPYSMWKDKEAMTKFLSKGASNISNWKMPFKI